MTPAIDQHHNAVLVIGAGIAGMAAGMHLAGQGLPVYLLDAAPTIGGSMHLLDHTFPTNSCGLCLMLPHQPAFCPTFECDRQPNLSLLPYAELVGLEGEPGAFTATVRHKARLVDPGRCTGCGDCAAVCPEARPHDHEGWLHPVKAIYRPPGLRALPDAWLIDRDVCTRCGACVDACPTAAVDLQMADREERVQVGAVLLTPGFAPFDARLKGEYGYRTYDNVLSALEFERLVSLAGSTVAHLQRPSDGHTPRKIAFVHCVGSRDNLCGAGHCSSACCMYTAKQVALAKQLDPDLQITVFFMDLRAFGKEFEAYVDAVQALPGVSYRRAMPSSVHQLQQSQDLLLTFAGEDGRLQEEAFDLLVLALGFAPPPGMQALARDLGVTLNDVGFALTPGYHPTHTSRAGVFVAGAFREPKDIPETVAEAAAAAAEVAAFLQDTGKARAQESLQHTAGIAPAGRSEEGSVRDVSEEEPRVGVFVCECNGDLAALDLAELVAGAQRLPGVALAQAVPLGCSAEGRAAVAAAIEAEGLNRVVVAGCSHRLYGDEFEAMMRDAGLDPRLLARANLREQVAFPHRNNGAGLTAKAHSLLAMAVAGLRALSGVDALALGARQALTRRAVVAGGGAAGLSAALALARLGIPVHLVERETQLGGQWRHIRYQLDGSDPQAALLNLIARVQADERITLHLGAEVTRLDGGPGHYRATLTAGDSEETVEHGVLLVATGGGPATTQEYLYGQDPRVLTQRELEAQIADGTLATVQRVVMIQCAGSREPGRPYCSRTCCTQAVKNALKLKELRPEVEVYVLYRELRTYGFREAAYQAARDAGVVFLRYELPHKPQVSANGQGLRLALVEPVTGLPLALDAGLLVLSVGIDPAEGRSLAGVLDVELNGDGFFREEHPKMKPLDLGRGGIYVAGLAHSPRFLEETLAQAQGAAMRAAAFLAPGEVGDRPTAVWVNERLCSFCGLCVEACPYGARVMNYDTRVADVDYALCQGCGVCAVVCPNKATLQKTFEHRQLMAAIDMALV
jgi:heterodisulfide reductase subunit A